ncbi:hypothetical protein ACFYNX_17940 [Streptomyces sp. NPDC007872]|uniref:hypothetical protein n=1 Tax=Streptomyces sp. NPDC007872 TaxID=3364782 RepID=UPI0036927111
MSIRHVRTTRRIGAAALLAAALTFSLAACGDEDGKGQGQGQGNASSSVPTPGKEEPTKSEDGKTPPDDSTILATFKGEKGVEMVIHGAKRDQGGFLTVTGEIKNTSGEDYTPSVRWNGLEQEVALTGSSFGAMTLTDSKEKKRYYVLRDTDNRPLTTTKYTSLIEAGETLPFFAQFPAPPNTTTEVGLTFPGFTTGTIEIS